MLGTIVCLIISFQISYGDFDLKALTIQEVGQDATGECYQQFKLINRLSLVKMVDSNPSLKPSGILEGNFINLGAYDECLSISDESAKIYGKYCFVSIELDQVVSFHSNVEVNESFKAIQKIRKKLDHYVGPRLLGIDSATSISSLAKYFHWGICIPDKCTQADLQKIMPLQFEEEKCYTKFTNEKLDTKAIIAIFTISGFMVIAICSTFYDVFCNIRTNNLWHQIFKAFSLYTNARKLFKSSVNSDQLGCLHGIKAISMMWVILGHTYLHSILTASIDNFLYLNDWLDDPKSMFILSATVSVDTFFTIGGLLTVYVFMKLEEIDLKESFKMIPMLYLHRYIRLTPALAIMVLAYGSGIIKYLSDGPKWEVLNQSIHNCEEHWWSTLLYMQNYVNPSKICIGQTWYLSVDFQLFILTPFFLIPLRKWPQVVIKVMSVIAVIGMIIPFCIGYSNKFTGIGLGMKGSIFLNYYLSTHTRFSPYVIGMIYGYNIYNVKKEGRPLAFRKGTLLFLWTLLLGGLLFCVFDGIKFVKESGNQWIDGLYLGLNRQVWSLIISSIILLCCTNNGGLINMFLSHPGFQLISKLSYSMYLIHYIVILIVIASSRTVVHFTNFFTLCQFFSFFLLTLSISVLFSLIFESPMITIEKLIVPAYEKKNEIIKESKENV